MGYRIAVKTQADAPTVAPQQAAVDILNPETTGAGAGQLQYAMSEVAADWNMKGHLYLIYSGSKDEFNQPIAIPANSTQLRFSLPDESATLDGWQLIAVP